jgi:hypothetical protein
VVLAGEVAAKLVGTEEHSFGDVLDQGGLATAAQRGHEERDRRDRGLVRRLRDRRREIARTRCSELSARAGSDHDHPTCGNPAVGVNADRLANLALERLALRHVRQHATERLVC